MSWPKDGTNTRPLGEWLELGEVVCGLLGQGMSQREVGAKLGRSQTWVSKLARWYAGNAWYLRSPEQQLSRAESHNEEKR